jgi:orotidine-5'-phosphate decarboxylase
VSERFGARLRAAMDRLGPLCVGIDPHPSLLRAWGLPDDPSGLEAFGSKVVEALAGEVAAFKPQSAFYERFGSRGVSALESTIRQLREAGALVILDPPDDRQSPSKLAGGLRPRAYVKSGGKCRPTGDPG